MVIPAVDIKNGKCVQLVQGKPGTEQVILEDPVKIACQWEDKGARMIHVIDLGGALGETNNLEIVREIRDSVSVPIQMGGGIRTKDDALNLLEMDINRIILEQFHGNRSGTLNFQQFREKKIWWHWIVRFPSGGWG